MDATKAKEARDLMIKANHIIKSEWDKNPEDNGAFACYKANNAVVHMLSDAMKQEPREPEHYYPLSRLVEALFNAADHYHVPVSQAANMVSIVARTAKGR